jgi:hypothetical protein
VLVSKTLPKSFSNIMHTTVQVINFMQSCVTNQAASKFPAKNLAQNMMSNSNTVKSVADCHCIMELWPGVGMFSKKTRTISLGVLGFQILSWAWLIRQTFFSLE